MKKKKIIIICVISLICLFILFFIISFAKDKSNSKAAMKVINSDYTVFIKDLEDFETKRDHIYDDIFGSGYAEKFKKNYKSYFDFFDLYGDNVSTMIKDSKNLTKYCRGIYYTDKDVNSKCQLFTRNYELMVNYYVLDVKRFNVLVKEYNKYLDDENVKGDKLSYYKAKYKYIDFDEDSKEDGKE